MEIKKIIFYMNIGDVQGITHIEPEKLEHFRAVNGYDFENFRLQPTNKISWDGERLYHIYERINEDFYRPVTMQCFNEAVLQKSYFDPFGLTAEAVLKHLKLCVYKGKI